MIAITDTALPLVQSPNILVYLDTTLAFYIHCDYVVNRVLKRNNVLNAISGNTLGQQKGTLLMTYKAIGRSSINYGAPVWNTNVSTISFHKQQIAQIQLCQFLLDHI